MVFALIFRIFHSDRTVMKRILFILFAVALGLNLNAQDECENPDLNCDGFVNVNDLLGMLSYFGDEEDGQWLDGDDCFSPDVNCDGFVNVNDLLVLLSSFGEQDLDGDGIWDSEDDCVCAIEGCTDIGACNFDPLATEDDGSCFVASDWISKALTSTAKRRVIRAAIAFPFPPTARPLPLGRYVTTATALTPVTFVFTHGIALQVLGNSKALTSTAKRRMI